MEKNQYELCIEVLRRLHDAGVLINVIIIGSWCIPFYEKYFAATTYIPTIKTRDIDLLVPSPHKFQHYVDVPELLKDLGFIVGFKGSEGYIMLENPNLIVEFLVPEKGRGLNKPYPLPQLGLNAQALRFINFLSHPIIHITIEDIPIMVPHPANFALHKLTILSRRKAKEKAEKDKEAAISILKALVEKNELASIKRAFKSAPKTWQKKIVKGLKEAKENNLLSILK